MLNYFNLNYRPTRKTGRSVGAAPARAMKSMTLGGVSQTGATTQAESVVAPPNASIPGFSIGQQILMYVGVLIGVIFSSAVGQFKVGQAVGFEINAAGIAVSAIIALVVIPYVYKQVQPDAKAPLLIQFGLFVQHGVFCQIILALIGKTIA